MAWDWLGIEGTQAGEQWVIWINWVADVSGRLEQGVDQSNGRVSVIVHKPFITDNISALGFRRNGLHLTANAKLMDAFIFSAQTSDMDLHDLSSILHKRSERAISFPKAPSDSLAGFIQKTFWDGGLGGGKVTRRRETKVKPVREAVKAGLEVGLWWLCLPRVFSGASARLHSVCGKSHTVK